MSSRRETTESERLLVVKWSKEGKSLREIASLIGVTHGCVQKILQKYKKTGSVANIPGKGRKEILSTTANRKIIHSLKKDPRFFNVNNMTTFSAKSEEEEKLTQTVVTATEPSSISLSDNELSDSDSNESNYHFQSIEGSFQAIACSSRSLTMPSAQINGFRGISFRNILLRQQITQNYQELKRRIKMRATRIKNSKYYLYLLSFSLILPILAIVLNYSFIGDCPPRAILWRTCVHFALVLLTGILGFLLLICRLITIFIRHFLPISREQELKKLTIVLFTLLILFFIAEMTSFYGMSAFDNTSKGYFRQEICAYIYGMNMVASIVLFLVCCSIFLDF
ncbi:uncharacterized protein TNCT_312851 [Trichonephila clavata]|uniref:Paired domain-containing protein n=1 Tax=Trichonephila clavata TaxID=2740835 RepID=A0A8X6HHX5_TRICU|nr:uncharacterized protein TNCT_312851 [Trichonephila clavata]